MGFSGLLTRERGLRISNSSKESTLKSPTKIVFLESLTAADTFWNSVARIGSLETVKWVLKKLIYVLDEDFRSTNIFKIAN